MAPAGPHRPLLLCATAQTAALVRQSDSDAAERRDSLQSTLTNVRGCSRLHAPRPSNAASDRAATARVASPRERLRSIPPVRLLLPTLLSCLVVLTGCTTTSITVDGEFPSPLVNVVPIDVGLYYDEAFANFEHREDLDQRGEWVIAAGTPNVDMFTTVLGGMFRTVQPVTSTTAGASAGLDAVIHPVIEELQFSTPFQTRNGFFEVWIKYRMQLFEKNGDLIAEWPLTAYGKRRSAMVQSSSSALNQAAYLAIREAGAFLARDFARVDEVNAWLTQTVTPSGSR